MPGKHIPLIMEIIGNIVSPDDRKRKYTDRLVLKILLLLHISGISYRSAGVFLTSHEEYLRMIGLKEITSFQTLSRRARSMDLHAINRGIVLLYSMKECAAIDSFMINTCKYSTAMRRKYWGNYRGPYDTLHRRPPDHGLDRSKREYPWFPRFPWHGGFCQEFFLYLRGFSPWYLWHIRLCVLEHTFFTHNWYKQKKRHSSWSTFGEPQDWNRSQEGIFSTIFPQVGNREDILHPWRENKNREYLVCQEQIIWYCNGPQGNCIQSHDCIKRRSRRKAKGDYENR